MSIIVSDANVLKCFVKRTQKPKCQTGALSEKCHVSFVYMALWSAIIKVESENSPKYGRIGRHRKVRKMATYEKSFKEEAVKLSDEIGIKKAAAQLGVPYYTLADWRHRQNIHGDQAHVGSGHKRETGDEKDRRIRELERENAELARANEILQEALGFFAKNRKK